MLELRDRIARELPEDQPVPADGAAAQCEAAMVDVTTIHRAFVRAELRQMRIDWHRSKLAELGRTA